MATLRQKRVAKAIVDNLKVNKPLTGGEIVENSGYGISMKKNPQVILNSQGVNEELKNYGFDPEKAKEVVGEILIAGENDTVKLKAADMIFKVHSTYAPEKHVNVNLNKTKDDKLDRLIEELETKLDDSERTTESE